jgi:hypothetical protein
MLWFILIVVTLLDPTAVLLPCALTRTPTWSIDHAGGARWVCKRTVERAESAQHSIPRNCTSTGKNKGSFD